MPDRLRLGLVLALVLALLLPGPLVALPEAAREPVDQARAANVRGDGIASEGALRRAMAAGASRDDVSALMGQALLLQNNPGKAGGWLEPARFGADAALGWRMLGRLRQIQGALPQAGQAYDRAFALTPNDPQLWIDIARLRQAGGEHPEAIEAAERALALDPKNPRAIELLAQFRRGAQGPVAVLALYEQGLADAPDDFGLLAGYAAALGDAGRYAAMLEVARKLYKLSPRNPLPFYFQAVIAARAGQNDLARSLMLRIDQRLDNLPAALLLQGALELEAGNPTLALQFLEELDARQPDNPRAQMLYALALAQRGELSRLRQRFGPLVDRPDAEPYLLTLLGRALEAKGDRAGAAALLDRAAMALTVPVTPIAGRNPAVPWRALPQSFEGSTSAGDAAFARKDFAAANTAYERAARLLQPDWLMLRRALALEQVGRAGHAVQLAEQYRAAFPENMLAPRLAGVNAALTGDWHSTVALLAWLDARKGHRDSRLLADLSFAQVKLGDLDAALANAEAAYALQRSSGLAAQARGLALAKAGRDPDIAAQLLTKARKIGGDNPVLREARASLARR